MASLLELIENLEKKADLIIKKNLALHEENAHLNSECDKLNNRSTEQKKIIEEIKEKNKMLKLAKSLSESNERSTDIKLKINELVAGIR